MPFMPKPIQMKLNNQYKILFFLLLVTNISFGQNDLNIIKERIVEDLMQTKIDDAKVASILENMSKDGSFKGIDYSDLSRNAGFPHRHHTTNLVYLGKAFKNKASGYYNNSQVFDQIVKGLKYWVDHDFVGENWHNNQITTPTNLGELMLILGDQLPKDLVAKAQPIIGKANMNASGARPSGDRIVIAGILAKNLLFLGEFEEFNKIIRIIEGELKFSTGQRGMQHDYSFHHRTDRVNNTDSYGYGKYANEFGDWSYYVANTKYAFSKDKINQLVDYYLDGIYKQSVYGIYADVSVQNRSISHKATFVARGTQEIERLLVSTDYRKKELLEIIQLRKGEVQPSASFAKFFWQTEHFVFQRPHFYTTVRMFSSRNRNMEVPYNGPGKTTHHRADGTNYVMLKGDEYLNIWPVYDWQKIAGTTILQKPHLPDPEDIQKEGSMDFVGAVTDGLYGSVAFDFKSPHDPLEAKKSWFFFDDAYVCLGTAINSSSELEVATTINQSLLRSDVQVMENGKVRLMTSGKRTLEDVKWIHHDNIGYVFLNPTSINLSNQTETGSWAQITDEKNISKEPVHIDVFNLWFNHGSKPSNASYAYIVVPQISRIKLNDRSNNNCNIKILSNTASLQAVKEVKLGISQLNFFEAGAIEIEKGMKVQIKSSGLVQLKMKGGKLVGLTVSDPSRKLERIELLVSGLYDVQGENYHSSIDPVKKETKFSIDLPSTVFLGKSVNVKF